MPPPRPFKTFKLKGDTNSQCCGADISPGDGSFCPKRLTKIKSYISREGTAVAQWLRCCATVRKVAGSIPAGVSEFFVGIKSFRPHYGPGVDSASNSNVYQDYFLGVKAAGA